MQKHLLTLYTRTPLHIGCGTSVDVVDLPIMRERITGFPVIPSTSLKGVLRQSARDFADLTDDQTRTLFGEDRPLNNNPAKGDLISAHAGCVQIMEAKLLAFPVRSLAGCFAWITCPAVLERYQRDTGTAFTIPQPQKNQAIAGSDLIANGHVILEEYALAAIQHPSDPSNPSDLIKALTPLTPDPLWTAKLPTRLAILHDEDFQHFGTTCTEVVSRVKISPTTRTVDGGALFNQENIPCETLFYTVLSVGSPRRQKDPSDPSDPSAHLTSLLKATPTLQIGGDETTGHGLCAVNHKPL